MTRTELIELVETAQANWDSCDWTHELRDLDGAIQLDENENAIMCDGGHEDTCATCRDAMKDADAAIEHGDKAIAALKSGDIAAAKEHVAAARDLENEWGDCPAWREASDAMEAVQTYEEAYAGSDVPTAVRDAISHANWFREEDDRLRALARAGNAAEIRKWATEIRSDWRDEDEDSKHWQMTADMWDAVAAAVTDLRAKVEMPA
ncbi:MAG TPA: hypothetical protein VHC90_19990 [Bryobacteraceae bacterium]|nr:hypothetical protein [Bryobacteraceae bacterium]